MNEFKKITLLVIAAMAFTACGNIDNKIEKDPVEISTGNEIVSDNAVVDVDVEPEPAKELDSTISFESSN